MTAAAEKMSERLLDLEDIIRPIAIEETRRYLDSKDLVTKDDLDRRLTDTEKRFDEKLGGLEKRFDEKLGSLEKRLDEKLGSLEKSIKEKLVDIKELVSERLQSTEKLLLEKHNGLLLRFVLILVSVMGIALGAIRLMYPPTTVQAISAVKNEAPFTQTR